MSSDRVEVPFVREMEERFFGGDEIRNECLNHDRSPVCRPELYLNINWLQLNKGRFCGI